MVCHNKIHDGVDDLASKTFSPTHVRDDPKINKCCVMHVIKYAHNTYDRRTQKIPSEDTIVLLPEEKANSCQRDIECWRVQGAGTCIVIDDGVTSMRNAFGRENTMLGKITFLRTCPFDN